MRVVLKGINIRVDESKLDIDLTHEYHIPDTDVSVICNYLRTGERDKVAELTRNGTLVTASRKKSKVLLLRMSLIMIYRKLLLKSLLIS